MKVGSISRNTLAALLQAIFVSGCLFLVYRIIVREAGLEQLGIWSLLMAGSAIARVGDVSGASSLGRFIAQMRGAGNVDELGETVHTVLLTSLALNMAICFALYAMSPILLPLVLSERNLNDALKLVPFIMASVILGGLSDGIAAGLDGVQRTDLRALVQCTGAVSLLATAAVLVPAQGVMGFGYAQLVSYAVSILLGWLVLRRHQPQIGWLPINWRWHLFKTTTGFGMKLSLIGILNLFFDPLVKFAFNKIGGPKDVALYELASRVITQVRGLVIASMIPLVPALAALQQGDRARFHELAIRAAKASAWGAVATTIASLILSPLVSYLVLGKISFEMLWLSIPLIFAWSANITGVTFYLTAQADGRMRWNMLSHLILMVFVIIGASTVGQTHGVNGLMASIVLGLTFSLGCQLFGNASMLQLGHVLSRSRLVISASLGLISSACLLAWQIMRMVAV